MLKNKYNFVSSFSRFISVNFYHNFYKDTLLKGLEIIPDKNTDKLLKNHSILVRYIENGFTLVSKKEHKFEASNFAGEIELIFFFKIKDSFFLNITDIPYTNNQKFIFKNTQDLANEKLHSNLFVDQENTQETDEDGIFGEICLTVNSKNQFFGSELASEGFDELTYSIYFNSRKVKFRYNFFSPNLIVNFEKYFITDEQDSFKLNAYNTRILSNGSLVYSIIIEDDILVSQVPSAKLFLKKDDDLLTYFSVFLPHPKPNTISYDSNDGIYYNDVFVKI